MRNVPEPFRLRGLLHSVSRAQLVLEHAAEVQQQTAAAPPRGRTSVVASY